MGRCDPVALVAPPRSPARAARLRNRARARASTRRASRCEGRRRLVPPRRRRGGRARSGSGQRRSVRRGLPGGAVGPHQRPRALGGGSWERKDPSRPAVVFRARRAARQFASARRTSSRRSGHARSLEAESSRDPHPRSDLPRASRRRGGAPRRPEAEPQRAARPDRRADASSHRARAREARDGQRREGGPRVPPRVLGGRVDRALPSRRGSAHPRLRPCARGGSARLVDEPSDPGSDDHRLGRRPARARVPRSASRGPQERGARIVGASLRDLERTGPPPPRRLARARLGRGSVLARRVQLPARRRRERSEAARDADRADSVLRRRGDVRSAGERHRRRRDRKRTSRGAPDPRSAPARARDGSPQGRKPASAVEYASNASTCGKCPTPGISTSFAPGIAAAAFFPSAG